MRIPYQKLGIEREGLVYIVDTKCDPLMMGAYRGRPGILPGYHMNKEHWLTILLDGSADDGLVKELFDISFELTNRKRKTITTMTQRTRNKNPTAVTRKDV